MQTPSSFTICPNCKQRIALHMAICPHCGRTFQATPPTLLPMQSPSFKSCSRCRQQTVIDAAFCQKCGRRYRSTAMKPAEKRVLKVIACVFVILFTALMCLATHSRYRNELPVGYDEPQNYYVVYKDGHVEHIIATTHEMQRSGVPTYDPNHYNSN